jgi:hypothetical protein
MWTHDITVLNTDSESASKTGLENDNFIELAKIVFFSVIDSYFLFLNVFF